MEEAKYMAYTATCHQGVIQMIWFHFWGAVMLSIFIYSLWLVHLLLELQVGSVAEGSSGRPPTRRSAVRSQSFLSACQSVLGKILNPKLPLLVIGSQQND